MKYFTLIILLIHNIASSKNSVGSIFLAPNIKASKKLKDIKLNTQYIIWKSLPIVIHSDINLKNEFVTELKEAINTWNKALGKTLFEYKGKSDKCNKKEIHCLILTFNKELQASAKKGHDYGYSEQFYDNFYWSSYEIYLNNKLKWATSSKPGKAHISNVILHELGHILGLQHHYFDMKSIMNYYPYESGISRNSVSEFDKQMVNWLYFNGKAPFKSFLYFIDNQKNKALVEFNKENSAINKSNDLNLLYLKARLERDNKNLESSEKYIKLAISKVPAEAPFIKAYFFNHLADLYFRKKNQKKALKFFEKSLEIFPNYYLTQIYVAHLRLLEKYDKTKILPLVKKALFFRPDNAMAKEIISVLSN